MKREKTLLNLYIIACINDKLVLGKDNDLLYYLPSDLKNFKSLTTDNVVIMGKNTYDSLPIKPLPNRENIVLTSDTELEVPNGHVCHSITDCLELCRQLYSDKKIFVIGGASIYRQFLSLGVVDKMFISHVHDDADGDVYFPDVFHNGEWEVEDEFVAKDTSKDDKPYNILVYKKKTLISWN